MSIDEFEDEFRDEFDGPGEEPDGPEEYAGSVSLFEGDEGGLELAQRQTLVTLLKQRFISARTHPRDWPVLTEHERVLRSRLNDLFLDLVIDRDREVAWKRQAVSETGSRFPTLLYDAAWSREETLVLVHLRDRFRAGRAAGDTRVFIDREDIVDHVATFRPVHATDEAGDERRARAAVASVLKSGLLIGAAGDERYEISEAIEPLLPLERLAELLAALQQANSRSGDDPDGGVEGADQHAAESQPTEQGLFDEEEQSA